jgi:hypothetical protein
METEAQKPQNQKNYENCPKHIESPVLITEHVVEYMMTGGALRVCARLFKWTKAQLETRLINFDLLEPGLHRCKTAANRQAGSWQGEGGALFRDPLKRSKERTSAQLQLEVPIQTKLPVK